MLDIITEKTETDERKNNSVGELKNNLQQSVHNILDIEYVFCGVKISHYKNPCTKTKSNTYYLEIVSSEGTKQLSLKGAEFYTLLEIISHEGKIYTPNRNNSRYMSSIISILPDKIVSHIRGIGYFIGDESNKTLLDIAKEDFRINSITKPDEKVTFEFCGREYECLGSRKERAGKMFLLRSINDDGEEKLDWISSLSYDLLLQLLSNIGEAIPVARKDKGKLVGIREVFGNDSIKNAFGKGYYIGELKSHEKTPKKPKTIRKKVKDDRKRKPTNTSSDKTTATLNQQKKRKKRELVLKSSHKFTHSGKGIKIDTEGKFMINGKTYYKLRINGEVKLILSEIYNFIMKVKRHEGTFISVNKRDIDIYKRLKRITKKMNIENFINYEPGKGFFYGKKILRKKESGIKGKQKNPGIMYGVNDDLLDLDFHNGYIHGEDDWLTP